MAHNTQKHAVLSNIRRALGVSIDDKVRAQSVESYDLEHARTYAFASQNRQACIELFLENALLSQAQVQRLKTKNDLAGAICSTLKAKGIESVRIGAEPYFEGLDFKTHHIHACFGTASPTDLVCLSKAHFGVAESGTLVVLSGADNPVLLNFLPDMHFVVVETKDIVDTYEDAWQNLRKRDLLNLPPRTIHFITGPSRSADIEQTLILGAHGPKELCIFIVG